MGMMALGPCQRWIRHASPSILWLHRCMTFWVINYVLWVKQSWVVIVVSLVNVAGVFTISKCSFDVHKVHHLSECSWNLNQFHNDSGALVRLAKEFFVRSGDDGVQSNTMIWWTVVLFGWYLPELHNRRWQWRASFGWCRRFPLICYPKNLHFSADTCLGFGSGIGSGTNGLSCQ